MICEVRLAAPEEVTEAFAIRYEVFVEEQGVSIEEESDGADGDAVHILAFADGSPVGCARMLIDGEEAHLGRLAVKRDYRSRGIGREICRYATDIARKRGCALWLNAQLHARGFYEKLGFKPCGEIFTEAGILHIKMTL